jgi:hypothetical protein
MMIFIPMDELYSSSNDFYDKLQFNHENFIGEETLFCIRGFNNFKYFDQVKKWKKHHNSSLTQKPASILRHVTPSALPTFGTKSHFVTT